MIKKLVSWVLFICTGDEYALPHLRDILHRYKLFAHQKSETSHTPIVLSYISYDTVSNGLADRLKNFITSYRIAEKTGRICKIYHDRDFSLQQYLIPNEYDWSIEHKDIRFNLNEAKPCYTISKSILSSRKLQIHNYVLHDWNDGAESDWGSVYRRLFKPSDYLVNLVENELNSLCLKKGEYIAIHIRFLDYFETVESNNPQSCTTSEDDKKAMIYSCKKTIDQIYKEESIAICLFSDSTHFRNIKHENYVKMREGKTGHIQFAKNNAEVYDGAFIDLYLMANAKKNINIIGENLYPSGYSEYAAKIGNVPYSRVMRLQ